MIKKQNIKTITIVLLITISSVSCDFIIKKGTNTNHINKTAVSKNKKEASSLLIASQKSLNTIALCKVLKKELTDKKVLKPINEIEQKQVIIYKNLQKVASENLILIANAPNQIIDTNAIQEKKLIAQIQENLKIQKDVFDSLTKQSNNQNIRNISEENIIKLNVESTKLTLEKLK